MKNKRYLWTDEDAQLLRDYVANDIRIVAKMEEHLVSDLAKTIDREIVNRMFELVGGSVIEIWWSNWSTK